MDRSGLIFGVLFQCSKYMDRRELMDFVFNSAKATISLCLFVVFVYTICIAASYFYIWYKYQNRTRADAGLQRDKVLGRARVCPCQRSRGGALKNCVTLTSPTAACSMGGKKPLHSLFHFYFSPGHLPV